MRDRVKMQRDLENLLGEFLKSSVNALAKIITLVENGGPETLEVMKAIYSKTGKGYIVGITGPPGAGKSTLTKKVAKDLCKRELTVGIIAVDPTSPFTGGAMLGDRLRMQDISNDQGVFIRSMATRGALGGVSKATVEVTKILDAFGKDFILVETVGVGQDEVEIAKIADTVVLIAIPGQGDEIQALKAGIMEIGHIFVVNKADRDGAERLFMDLQMMLDLSPRKDSWRPPLLKAVATTGEGVEKLTEVILYHKNNLEENGILTKKRKDRIRREVIGLIEQEIEGYVHKLIKYNYSFDEIIEQITNRQKDPYSFVREITAPLGEYFKLNRKEWKGGRNGF